MEIEIILKNISDKTEQFRRKNILMLLIFFK